MGFSLIIVLNKVIIGPSLQLVKIVRYERAMNEYFIDGWQRLSARLMCKVRNVCTQVFIFTKEPFIISVCARPAVTRRRGDAENFLEALYRRGSPESV